MCDNKMQRLTNRNYKERETMSKKEKTGQAKAVKIGAYTGINNSYTRINIGSVQGTKEPDPESRQRGFPETRQQDPETRQRDFPGD